VALSWKKDDLVFQNGVEFDTTTRWLYSGNMPISVFKIFCNSIQPLLKTASFFRNPTSIHYNDLCVDEIYLLNAFECSKVEELKEFFPYLRLV